VIVAKGAANIQKLKKKPENNPRPEAFLMLIYCASTHMWQGEAFFGGRLSRLIYELQKSIYFFLTFPFHFCEFTNLCGNYIQKASAEKPF